MRSQIFRTGIVAVGLVFVCLAAAGAVKGQDSPQSGVASKTAVFGSVAKADAAYTGAIDAHKLNEANKLIGKDGAFRGKVTKVFSPKTGTVVILNFDRDYKSALTAVVQKADFAKFPDLAKLDGKEVVITGKFIDFHDAPEIVLTDPSQILVVK